MVNKYVLLISDKAAESVESAASAADDVEALISHNQYLHKVLTKYKNKITEYYKSKLWDRYKKLSNEYEFIFNTPNHESNISTYNPVSRSFFKMWELLHDFKDELNIQNLEPINAIFLAEGPGGFAEALIKYRGEADARADASGEAGGTDQYYGISLKATNKNIPDWKYQDKISICYGSDNTGDLYKKHNLDYLNKNLPKMHFITADGGFDFSYDFNAQEESSIHLILCEIYAALTMQLDGGSFILKIYDIFHEYTIKLIILLKYFYKDIYIVKPLTSRPANSEKYLICIGFAPGGSPRQLINKLGDLITSYTPRNVQLFFDTIKYSNHILHNIVSYNVYYTFRQVYYIEQTITYIREFSKTFHDDDIKNEIKKITDDNRLQSLEWCKKYKIEYREN